MKRFFVEDAAHDAILKQLQFAGNEIEKCGGQGNTIVFALAAKQLKNVGLIDRDKGTTNSKLTDVKWMREDDFDYGVLNTTLFIRFSRNIEDWLERASVQYKIELPVGFKLLHGTIHSKSLQARQFLQILIDGKPQPSSPILLRDLIRKHLQE